MEEFYKKYGVRDHNDLMENVKSNGVFAAQVISDLLEEKYPAPVEEPVAEPAEVKAE